MLTRAYQNNNHQPGGDFMGGSVIYDKNSKRHYISIYWQGKRYKIFKHPITGDPFFDKRSAEKQLGKLRTQVDEKTFTPKAWFPDSPLSTRIYANEWLEVIEVSENTHSKYSGYVSNYIIPFFQDSDIRSIRYIDLVKFHKSILLGDKSKYNILSCLRAILRHAWKNEDIQKVPPFPTLSYTLPEIEYLAFEDQERVLKHIHERHKPIFQIAMEYGYRVQEVRALQWDCVDFSTGIITIRRSFSENTLQETTKTHRIRKDPITDYARVILKAIQRHVSPFVFIRTDGKPYTGKHMNKLWHPACEKAGVKIKMQNAFRHSLGCQLLDQGEDMDLVREQLGHTQIKMTMRYAKRKTATRLSALEKRRKIIDLASKRPVTNDK
jgi:integrase